MYKYFSAALALSTAFLATQASAITFDSVTSNGTASVGTGGDYATLADAATAFNGLATNSLQGNWKLEILNDLTEAANVGFGNELASGSSLTIKPATGTSVTVTFSAIADNAGPSGNLHIGARPPLSAWTDLTPTNNITIDGSNNGSDSRNLTITNTAAAVHTFSIPISLTGAVDNITIKNVSVQNIGGTSGSNIGGLSGISVVSRYDVAVSRVPGTVKIHNNDIIVRNGQGHGLNLRISGSSIPNTFPAIGNFEITSNSIVGRLRGIFLDTGMNGIIDNNEITVGTTGGTGLNGYGLYGVQLNSARATTNQSIVISNNKIFVQTGNLTAGDYGANGIGLNATTVGGSAKVFNNMFNFRFVTSATARPMAYTGIRAIAAMPYEIYQNSINMPDFPNLSNLTPVTASGQSAGNAYAIRTATTGTSSTLIKNNIIRVDQANAAAIVTLRTGTINVTSDNNVIYRDKANTYVGISGSGASPTTSTLLSEWQSATSQDANSVSVNPTLTAGSKWEPTATNADLHFNPPTAAPVEMPQFARLAEVLTDIDGATRPVNTLPGADEVNPSSVYDWSVY